LWLALAACATTTGGVLAAYSYISPLLIDQAGIPAGLVPLALTGFGIGSLAGSIVGGRVGDAHPHLATIVAPAATTVILLLIWLLSGQPVLTAALVVLLGLFGLGANPILVSMAVRFAGRAPTIGSSLSVSAFNIGTAVGSWLAGLALVTPLGAAGPAMVGTVIAALTLIPAAALALAARSATAVAVDPTASAMAAGTGRPTTVRVGN
jgi:DHA1 family inner membrane transport protein